MKLKLKDSEKHERSFPGFGLLKPGVVYETFDEMWIMRFKKSEHVEVITEVKEEVKEEVKKRFKK